MRNFCLFIMGLVVCFSMSAYAQPKYQNTLTLNILNTTGFEGFIGTCSEEIQPDGSTLCSTPQEIKKGTDTILVPPYSKSYPVFSTDGTNYFSCATLAKPKEQLFFSVEDIKTNTLLLESLIPDKSGNNIAMLCGLQPSK